MTRTTEVKRAEWNLLVLYPPGKAPISAGVLLLDSATDRLYVRVRTDLDLDEDMQEVIALLAESLEQTATEKGGAETLLRFEEDWSHALRLGSRRPVTIVDPVEAVQKIFAEHVLQNIKEESPGKSPVFSKSDLLIARKSIPLVPAVAIRALSSLRDSSVSFKEIEKILLTEPTIAAHLVRLANSALFAGGREVRSVSEALLRLGAERAALHVAALMLREAFSSPQLRRIWDHSIQVVQIARELCTQLRFHHPGEAMLVALVHDIGQLALFGLGAPFQARYSFLRGKGQYPIQIERELCGSSHAEIGADLLQEWLFPADLVEAVRNHHEPTRSTSHLGRILYLAESLSDTDEDVLDIAEHASVLTSVCIRTTDLVAIPTQSGFDMKMLRFAASAGA